jgi:hypothetical protein
MPTVFRSGGARFFFFSNEGTEGPHVHIQRAGATARSWLDPVSFASSRGFATFELHRLRRVVAENRARLLRAWYEHFPP